MVVSKVSWILIGVMWVAVGGIIWRKAHGPVAVGALAMPVTREVDDRCWLAPPWQAARVPCATRFDLPLGTEHGALVYNAQPFRAMNVKRGGPHLGDDLNGIGGMDTDFGDPVFAVADGLVLYAGTPSSGWGNVLVIAHKTADGRVWHSMVAHLSRMDAAPGAVVARGQIIGAVGTADGRYLAHLHFEMRASDEVDIGPGYAQTLFNRLDPTATVIAFRHAEADELAPAPMAVMLAADGLVPPKTHP